MSLGGPRERSSHPHPTAPAKERRRHNDRAGHSRYVDKSSVRSTVINGFYIARSTPLAIQRATRHGRGTDGLLARPPSQWRHNLPGPPRRGANWCASRGPVCSYKNYPNLTPPLLGSAGFPSQVSMVTSCVTAGHPNVLCLVHGVRGRPEHARATECREAAAGWRKSSGRTMMPSGCSHTALLFDLRHSGTTTRTSAYN